MQHQKFRDDELDTMIREWVEKVVGEPVNRQLPFGDVFKDGILLCKVINKIKPGSIPKINTGKLPFHKMENIGKYIEACKKLGMGGDKLFTTPDLFEEKKLSLVKFNIYSLGMHAQTVPGWNGPGLEQLKPPDPINLVESATEVRSPRSKLNKADQSTESKPTVAPDQVTSDTLDWSLKEAFKYNPELEKCARDWIEQVVGQPLPHPSLATSLRDGIILCKLLNIIQPGTVPKINTDSRNKFKCLENIVAYIKGCQGMGFPTDHIFDPADLFDEKNLNLVLSNIQTMGSVFSPKVAGDRLPVMKTPSSAPSFYSSLIQVDDSTPEDHALAQELLRWANLTLEDTPHVGSLEELRTGVAIIRILEKLTKQSVGYYEKEPTQHWHSMQNVVCILRFIGEQTGTALRYPTKTDLLLGRPKPLNTLLSFVRDKFDQDFRYKDVTTNERRSRILEEIVETEETYVSMLSKVYQWLIKPLQQARAESEEVLTEDEEKEIFSNLPSILSLHQDFVKQLSARLKSSLPLVSDLFSSFKQNFTQLYMEYVKNFDSVYVMIKFIKKKKRKFKELIKAFELEQAKTNALDLGSFLILPVQRLPRYMLLLAELEKFTEEDHPDKKGLQKAISDVKETLDILDKSKCENATDMTSNQKISAIARNIQLDDFELVHPQRRYVREGPVKMDPEDPNPYTFLFNDVILYTEHRREIPPDDPYARQFKYVSAIPLSFCEGVRENGEDPSVFELLLEEGETMSFFCPSPSECKSWVDDVKTQMALGITLDFQ